MPSPTNADVGELVRRLVDAGVEFIVVGGAAAVLYVRELANRRLAPQESALMLPVLIALAEKLEGSKD